ncbi:MAG: 50S ribosomal protein L4 [Christensenellaceae bacterium]|jgi:large subunit ribosomal protein L4|nr:50S ribosomal protein L4 [Christensenellaceae bacterium]
MSEVKTATQAKKPASIKIDVLDQKGKVAEQMTLNSEVFGVDVNTYLIHAVATAQANNARQGTKKTLDRAEVRGHGKKPYKQKGTGNARQGSTKGPQFDGGGMAFAIEPRDFSTKINKKQRAAAFVSAISGKLNDKELIVLQDLKVKDHKTKNVADILKSLVKAKLGITDKSKILFVKNGYDIDFIHACENIPNIETITAAQLSVLDIVTHKFLVATSYAIKAIEEAYA